MGKKTIIIDTERTERGYSGACDLLPGWIVASTGDFDRFKREVADSIRFYVDCARADGDEYPSVLDGDYQVEYRFDVRSLLAHYQNVFSFSALQAITGINQKQLAHYAAGRSKPRGRQSERIAEGLHKLAVELMSVRL